MARKPVEYIEIEVDGRPLSLPKDTVLLWSLRDLGFDIPHFCAHKWLEPLAACRMCLVNIELGGRMMAKPQASCVITPEPGMKVFTEAEEVLKIRKEQMEFHLINHPLECPVCDKGGECMLQDQSMDHGWKQSRYVEQKRFQEDAVFNEYINMNYKRCIHCKRCVSFCEDIDSSHLLKFVDRAAGMLIEAFPVEGEAPRFCGNTIDMCPVGALTARNYRFMGRPWEQEYRPSVGSLDSVGANIHIVGRLGRVDRIVPRDNPGVEDGLIDDVTRFSWECIDDERRVRKAIVRGPEGDKHISQVAGEFEAGHLIDRIIGEHGPESVGIVAGGGLNTEEYLAIRLFCDELETPHFHLGDELFSGKPPSDAALASLTCDYGTIEEIHCADTVLLLGTDLFDEAPALGLRLDVRARRGQAKLLTARSFGSDNDQFATLHLGYNYGELLRVVRGLTNALSGQGEAPGEYKELANHLRTVGDDIAILYGREVWDSADPNELIKAIIALKGAISDSNPEAQGVYLNPVYPSVNSVGALVVNHLERFSQDFRGLGTPAAGSLGSVLEAAASGRLKVLVIIDADILSTYRDRALVERALAGVDGAIYIGPFENPTSAKCAIHLPLGTFAHREGTVLSMEWRLQRRAKAALHSVAPEVFEVLNGISVPMERATLAFDREELCQGLRAHIAGWPECAMEDFAASGVLLVGAGHRPAQGRSETGPYELPELIEAEGEELVLAPKYFIYNDRDEVRYSPVFERVVKPFFAFLSPKDMEALQVQEGGTVEISADSASITLPAKAAAWVRPGSVVLNDYCIAAPANLFAPGVSVKLKVAQVVAAGGGE